MLLDMRWRGVRVDEAGAENARKLLEKHEKEIHKWIKDETGLTVEPWNATSLSKAFDKMKVAYPRTEKTDAPSFTKQFASHEHPLAQQIVRLRELNKANTTFISNILKFTHKGRIQQSFIHFVLMTAALSLGGFLHQTQISSKFQLQILRLSQSSVGCFCLKKMKDGATLTTHHKSR